MVGPTEHTHGVYFEKYMKMLDLNINQQYIN